MIQLLAFVQSTRQVKRHSPTPNSHVMQAINISWHRELFWDPLTWKVFEKKACLIWHRHDLPWIVVMLTSICPTTGLLYPYTLNSEGFMDSLIFIKLDYFVNYWTVLAMLSVILSRTRLLHPIFCEIINFDSPARPTRLTD